MDEQKIAWDKLIHPDMEAIKKRDAFLSDENEKKLREMIDQIHLTEEILDCNNCKYPNECENCARAIEDRPLLKENREMPFRCKTCAKHTENGFCRRWMQEIKDDDYCSFGERI